MSAITDTARGGERVSEPRINADDTDLNESEALPQKSFDAAASTVPPSGKLKISEPLAVASGC